MTYSKGGTMAYNLHIIKTKRFKKTVVRVNFRHKFDKQSITYRNLLCEVLFNSTKKYPTMRDMSLKTEDLYGANYLYRNTYLGQEVITSFELTYLDDQHTETGNGKEAIRFLHEILFAPNVVDGAFDSKEFQKAKAHLIEKITAAKENSNYLATRGFLKAIFHDSELQYTGPGYLEDLEQIDEKGLYEYYQHMINRNIIDIFVCGDVNSTEIKHLFEQEFPVNTVKKPSTNFIVKQDKFRKRCRIVIDPKEDFQQSILIVGAKVNVMDEFERKYVSSLYNYILGGGSDSLLFQNVREKHSLCYSIYSNFDKSIHLLSIRAGIDASHYQKAVSLIRRTLKDIADGKFDEEQIERFKMVFRTSREEMTDTPYSMIGFYQAHEYTGMDLNDVSLKEIEKLTKDMVVEFAKKIHLDTIYLLKGGNRHE